MYKEERQQAILEVLNEKTYVSVGKLSSLLYVSLPTVRRDLTELEKQGLIVRNHGGAMRLAEGSYRIPIGFRSGHNTAQKQSMCKAAAELVENGDVIFIDCSTSTVHIADFITAKDITAVTNSLPAATSLIQNGIKTFLAGGTVTEDSLSCIGSEAEAFLAGFNFRLVFFSSYGINKKGMIVDTSPVEIRIRKAAFANCEKKVFLSTKDKYDRSAPYNLLPLDEVDVIITEEDG